jgi:hypothetical protein
VGSSCEFGIEPSGSMKCWETIRWNVRCLHQPCSLTTVSRELSKYKLDLVGVLRIGTGGGLL